MPESSFTAAFGYDAAGSWSAPGRVNLVGEHTDYNGGASLPIAIDRRTVVRAALRDDDTVRVGSTAEGEIVETRTGALRAASGWSSYPLGVLWALLDATGAAPGGLDIWIDSDVPVGAGVSSSAALEAAVCVAANDLWNLGVPRDAMVTVCQRAENLIAGAPTGTLDQTAALQSSRNAALLIEFGAGHTESVPLALDAAGLALLVVDSGVRHDHTDGAYGKRRAECNEAAELLGVDALAEVSPDRLSEAERALPPALARRVRHVVTDTARCRGAANLLRDGKVHELGPILTAAHVSMRDDFEASAPAVDAAVDASARAGALGARITGGGFGGACIVLTHAGQSEWTADQVRLDVTNAGHPKPHVFAVTTDEGARRDE